MNQLPISKYPTTFFRVSLKAVIRNDQGEVLCVKENGSDWTLPGGGLDHGETIEQGLTRELHEEVDFDEAVPFTYAPLGHDIMFLQNKEAWQLWVMFEVSFTTLPRFAKGVDADDIAFIDPETFAHSELRAQQLIYKWCAERSDEK